MDDLLTAACPTTSSRAVALLNDPCRQIPPGPFSRWCHALVDHIVDMDQPSACDTNIGTPNIFRRFDSTSLEKEPDWRSSYTGQKQDVRDDELLRKRKKSHNGELRAGTWYSDSYITGIATAALEGTNHGLADTGGGRKAVPVTVTHGESYPAGAVRPITEPKRPLYKMRSNKYDRATTQEPTQWSEEQTTRRTTFPRCAAANRCSRMDMSTK